MKKIKSIKFINTKTKKEITILFSRNNNIIVGPKGGGKSTLSYIVACAISNSNKTNIFELPKITIEKLREFNLELKVITFYDEVTNIDKFSYNKKTHKNLANKQENEITNLNIIINSDKRIILQNDKVKNNFFDENIPNKKEIYKDYLTSLLDDKNISMELIELIDCSVKMSNSIFKIKEFIIKPLDDKKIDWYEINNLSCVESKKDSLNLISIKTNISNNLVEIENFKKEIKKYLENLSGTESIKAENSIITNYFRSIINDIGEQKEKLIKKTEKLLKITNSILTLLQYFNSSLYDLTKIFDDDKKNYLKNEAYKTKSTHFFSSLAENFKIINDNFRKISLMKISEIKFDKKDIWGFLDKGKYDEYCFQKDNKIELSFNEQNLVNKNIIENIFIDPNKIKNIKDPSKIFTKNTKYFNIIFDFLMSNDEVDVKSPFFKFKDYIELNQIEIKNTFIERNLNNIFLNVYDSINKQTKSYDILSSGEKSIYGITSILDKFNNEIILIDQPEDNLDNETISEHILDKLRERNKKNLQTFIITHNANIGILSNTENSECSLILANIHKEGQEYLSINDPWNPCNMDQKSINYLEGSFDNLKKRFDILSTRGLDQENN